MEGGATVSTATSTTQQSQQVENWPSSPAEVGLKSFIEQQQQFTTRADTDTKVPLFADLHVHLMGMGDVVFWTRVMTKVIPSLSRTAALDDDDRWNEYLDEREKEDASFAKLDELAAKLRVKKKEKFREEVTDKQSDPDVQFVFDVVYSVQTLCKAVGKVDSLTSADYKTMRFWVLERLTYTVDNNNGHFNDVKNLFQWFWVFNARKQKFEKLYGITNTSFVTNFLNDPNDPVFVNCFERSHSTNDDSPELFYARNAMKCAIISQYPIVLDVLLRYSLNNYAIKGMNYVEISVGLGLVELPWMFTHLSHPTHDQPLKFGDWPVSDLRGTVPFRYLAAFDRRKVKFSLKPEDNADQVDAGYLANGARFILQGNPETIKRCFKDHLKSLNEIENRFEESRKSAKNCVIPPLHIMCVGLDYCGHELYYPHCSFALSAFTKFVFLERSKSGHHFGLRINAGDLLHLKDLRDDLVLVHMGVMATGILRILDAYTEWWKSLDQANSLKEVPTDCPPPLRIGHGTAFLEYLQKNDLPDLPPRHADDPPLVAFKTAILHALKKIHKLRIPIEVAPSRTHHLQRKGRHLNPVYKFVQKGFCVVVCSDNSSLLEELKRGVRGSGPRKSLQPFQVATLLGNYRYASFGRREDFQRSSTETSTHTIGERTNSDEEPLPDTATGIRLLCQKLSRE